MFLDVLPFQPPLHKGDVIDGVRIVSDAVNVGGFGRVYRAVGCMDNPSVQYAVKEFCVVGFRRIPKGTNITNRAEKK